MERLFLCTDLDRTLLPNGTEPESRQARMLFARLVARPEVTLAYASGRDLTLVEDAIHDYALPLPGFAITDVGTKIHARRRNGWEVWQAWEDEIGADWAGHDRATLNRLLTDIEPLRLQEAGKQNTYKLSYYLPVRADRRALQDEILGRLGAHSIRASLVWSVDEPADVGLLDVVPQHATKLHAIEFLADRLDYTLADTVFAGDSGNDLEVMESGVPSVLVANATAEVRGEARRRAEVAGHRNTLYIARGGYLGMNGNYSAGILEGVLHFHPELAAWIETDQPA